MAVVADALDSREWQDLLRISEDLRQAVCRIHAKLASEREILLAERAAAAAEKAAATAEREQAERFVKMISAAAERCAWTGAKEATQLGGRAMPGQSTAAPKQVVVKQPPQRPAQSTPHAAPTNGSYPVAAPPMPSRSPPPVPASQAQVQAEVEPSPGPRVKAPPNQGKQRAASSVPAVIPEAQSKDAQEAKAVRVQSQESGSTGSSSAILASLPGNTSNAREDLVQDAPAQHTPKRSNVSSEEVEEVAVATNESINGTRVEPLLDDLEEDEMDEHDLWAMNAPSPPSKAPPTECPHYRVMPPPRMDPLPSDPFPTPDSDEMDTGLSFPPEEDREYAPTEEAFESELERGAEDSSASRVPVKAMPGRDGPSSSAWPVGKAAASRYKAPPAALFGSSASSSDRRETVSEAQAGSASSVATPEASAGMTTLSVKAPPHRSTPSG